MLGANTTITVLRAIQDSNTQKAYGGGHATVPAYRTAISQELSVAQGEPMGQTHTFSTEDLVYPTDVQISDLLTDNENGAKYVVSGVARYENHLTIECTTYTAPSFSV